MTPTFNTNSDCPALNWDCDSVNEDDKGGTSTPYLCDRCGHKEVCMYRSKYEELTDEYVKMTKKIKAMSGYGNVFPMDIELPKCKKYIHKPLNVR